MFLASSEPMLVEIHRKYNPNESCIFDSNFSKNDCHRIKSKTEVLQITQNEQTTKGASVKNAPANTSLTIKLVVSIKSSQSAKSSENCLERACKTTQTDTSYFLYDSSKEATGDHFTEDDRNLLEQCLAPEIDIEVSLYGLFS